MRQDRRWFARGRKLLVGALAACLLVIPTPGSEAPVDAQASGGYCVFWGGHTRRSAYTTTDGSCDEVGVNALFFDALAGGYVWSGWRTSRSRRVSFHYSGIVGSDHTGYRSLYSY